MTLRIEEKKKNETINNDRKKTSSNMQRGRIQHEHVREGRKEVIYYETNDGVL